MATNDPKSRLTEGNLNSPSYPSPNGITDQRGNAGGTTSGVTAGPDVGRRDDETPGEKIGRFFRKAMDRLAGRDEDWERRRDLARDQRDRDQFSYRTGSAQSGRSGQYARGQGEWSDLGRSRDDRSQSYRGGPTGDTGGSYERYQGGSGSAGYGQGTTGRPYGQGQGSYSPSSVGGQGGYERDESRFGVGGQGPGAYGQRQGSFGPSFENRGSQSSGQRALGRSSGES
ncbi:MAG TPA: hypothetical protein VFD38_05570, partial [Myxococcaceae bacterium]|nr:hypothetical protein [Myxococcaceae bacterium]